MGVTKQLQKTRNAGNITEAAITQKQSQEVVQILLHGGLSCLSYLRNFFPEKAYDSRVLEMNDHISYQRYADGNLSQDPKRAKKPNTAMQVLQRGRSKRVDLFLNWLETGAFDALKEGRLRALQLYVHADPNDRQKVIETYTFTIKYHQDPKSRMAAGVEIESGGLSSVTAEASNSGLQIMLRDIMKLCNALPDLPETRYISMTLFYLPEDGLDYHLKGFVPSTSEKLLFASADGWEKRTQTLQELDSGFHVATLKVAHLYQSAIGSFSQLNGHTRIPSELEYLSHSSKQDDIVPPRDSDENTAGIQVNSETLLDAIDKPKSIPERSKTAALSLKPCGEQQQTATPLSTSEVDSNRVSQIEHNILVKAVDPSLEPSRSLITLSPMKPSTRFENIPLMKKAFQGMMQPECLTQGDTQTQTQTQPPLQTPSNAVKSANSSKAAWASIAKTATAVQPSEDGKLVLLPEVVHQLVNERGTLQRASRKLAQQASLRPNDSDFVLCQCGYPEEEDDMMRCSYCSTWQHLRCYGFSGARDPRLPNDHACYQCILGKKEDYLLEKLSILALKRRAMSFALQNGLKRKSDLASYLSVSVETADMIHKHLRQNRYITATSLSHKPGFAATGKPLWVPVTEGPSYHNMLAELFDPLTHLAHFYTNATVQTAVIAEQLQSLKSENMPAPATPFSKLRNKATPTTASDLDLRASATPYETPVRAQSSQAKRRREDDNVPTTRSKRLADSAFMMQRLESVQSRYILNADGLSSSPAP